MDDLQCSQSVKTIQSQKNYAQLYKKKTLIQILINFTCTEMTFKLHCNKIKLAGFGENSRVLDWCFRRCDNADVAERSPIGYIPKANSINIEGLEKIDMEKLFDIPREYWMDEVERLRRYYDEQLGSDLPSAVQKELNELERRVKSI